MLPNFPSTNREQAVMEFQTAMGQGVSERYTVDLLQLRLRLLKEEFEEVQAEVQSMCCSIERGRMPRQEQMAALLGELADLQYVLSGFAVTFSLPLGLAFNAKHKANMSKLDPETGKPVLREDGKVLKGPHYKPADLTDLV